MRIIVVVGDITEFSGDAVVNPANSLGLMGGGVALAIKRKGGDIVEEEARKKAPIPIGRAVVTTAGKLKCRYVIHAPTVERPGGRSSRDRVYRATKAALTLANEMNLASVALPLMGAGVGGLTPEESLNSMIAAILEFSHLPMTLYIYLKSEDLVPVAERILAEHGLIDIGGNAWTTG